MLEIAYEEYSRACVAFMQELIRTPSVNGEQNEKAVADLVVKEAIKLGLVLRVIETEPDRPNVFVGTGFDSPDGLLLVAHADTVPVGDESKWQYGPFSGEIVNGKLYGRGALDCKGGLAIGLYVLKILQDTGQGHLAKLLSGADEESGADSQFGIRAVLREGLKAKGAVYLYGGTLNSECIIGHRGLVRAWVACEGESVHSGSRDWQERIKGENAIMGIVEFLGELQSVKSDTTSEFFPQYRTVVTPTLIRGGEGESMVAGRSEALLDIRTLPGDNEKMLGQVRHIAKKLSQGKRRYRVTVKNTIPAVITDPEAPLVREMLALVKEQLHVDNPVLRGSGPANESYMLIEAGIPTITGFGPTGEGFHSPNEYAEVESIKRSLEFLVRLSRRLINAR